jgi:hypothetical protein
LTLRTNSDYSQSRIGLTLARLIPVGKHSE